MKKLFAIILSVVLVAAFSITAYAGTNARRGQSEEKVLTSCVQTSAVSQKTTCPNYADGNCTNPACPNDGVPARDGSGYKGGQDGQGNGANGKGNGNSNCAYAGTGACKGGRNAA